MTILINTPMWVWVIFLFLIIMGIKQLKPRTVKLFQLLIVPAIFLPLLIISIMTLDDSFIGFMSLIIGLCIGIFFGKLRWKNNPILIRKNNDWQQKASIYPLFLYVLIFISRYMTTAIPYIEPSLPTAMPMYIQEAFITITGVGIGGLLAIVIFKQHETT